MNRFIFSIISLVISLTSYGQNKDTTLKNFFFLETQGDSVSIVIHQEKIKISKRKMDSFYKASIKNIKSELNKKETKEKVRNAVNGAESKLSKVIDALVDNPEQKIALKKDLKESIKNSNPQIDSLFIMLNKLVNSIEINK